MYIPAHFEEVDPACVAAIMADAPLACIVAHTDDGLIANHVPLLAAPDGTLIGHIARANDMHRIVPQNHPVMAIFRREDAYVSPNYYPTKQDHHRHVPTWNYEVVHIHGQITFQHDDHAKRAAVGLLTRIHERRVNGEQGWKMADAPTGFLNDMLGNIVAFRISVQRRLAKSKLSQNRDEIDYCGVVEGLEKAGQTGMAERMAGRVSTAD